MYSQKDFDLIKKIVLKKIENTKYIYLFGSYALSEEN
jgi:predicted nucleotidyltransferase